MATALASQSLLGIGVYSLPEAARLLKAPLYSVRRWANGYWYQAGDNVRVSQPVVGRQLGPQRLDILTFLDLIELHFVVTFRKWGVKLTTIRKAAVEAARDFQTSHPFSVRQFDTDGSRIFSTLEAKERAAGAPSELIKELGKAQLVFTDQVRPYFLNLDYGMEGAVRYWPLGRDRCVVLDPTRAFGKPIDAASGVPTWPLFQAFEGGESMRDIADWYQIPAETVACAVEYEKSLLPA